MLGQGPSETAWKRTAQYDVVGGRPAWNDFGFVAEKREQCTNTHRNATHEFCTFVRPSAGEEHGHCVAAEWWTEGQRCEGVDLGEKKDDSRGVCEIEGDACIYTPFSVGGVENPTKWQELKWKVLSSFTNLFLIQGGGQVYERLAGRLNRWENHRTQTEFTDMIIAKAFFFQFINNYFTLFYIAFLINIPFCADPSPPPPPSKTDDPVGI